jgi:hypothetical protein
VGAGSQSNVVTVAVPAGYTDPNPANNTAYAFLTVTQAQADLSVTTTPNTYSPLQGQPVTFQLVLSNTGPSSVTTSIFVTNIFSSGLRYASDTSGGAYNSSTGIWTVPGLAAPGSVSISITATAVGAGSQSNVVTVAVPAGYTDPNPANNTAYAFPYVTATTTSPPVVITNIQLTGSSGLMIQGTANTNSTCYLLQTTQLQAPITWTTNSITTSDSSGRFSFTLTTSSNKHSFFIVAQYTLQTKTAVVSGPP